MEESSWQAISVQGLCARSLKEVSWQDLCTSSLYEVSWQDLRKKSLYKFAPQGLYKRSLGKIAVGDLAPALWKRSLRDLHTRSLQEISKEEPCSEVSVRPLGKMSARDLSARSLYKISIRLCIGVLGQISAQAFYISPASIHLCLKVWIYEAVGV